MQPGFHFTDVSISLPSKVQGPDAEEEWQEVDWVVWSSGEVSIDTESFLMIFKPSGSATVKAKPLGNLIRSSVAQGEDESKTFIVTTSESLHRMYRLTFSSSKHAADFSRISEQAEKANEASSIVKDLDGDSANEANLRLEAEIQAQLHDRVPLTYAGSELYGPDPNGDSSTEVLLGRGVAVLIDPPDDSSRVGSYELLFYSEDEGASSPIKRVTIGPKMTFKRQSPSQEVADASFVISATGLPVHTLTFEAANVAAAFSRDFTVRKRLMDISLKTARGQQTANQIRGELEDFKSRSFSAQVRRALCVLLILAITALLCRLALLFLQDKVKRAPLEYVKILSRDIQQVTKTLTSSVWSTGLKVCEVAFGAVPTEDLRRCRKLTQVSEMKRCIDVLTGHAPVLDGGF